MCFAVDATRSWYNGGDEGYHRWHDDLQAVTAEYSKVVLLGDSMGAAACMLFAPLATAVVAFCPQLHLQSSSIRPCESDEWYQRYHERVFASLEASTADIQVCKCCACTGEVFARAHAEPRFALCMRRHGNRVAACSVDELGTASAAGSANTCAGPAHTPRGSCLQVHTGTWQHDLDQVKDVSKANVTLNVHPLDTHRIAFALDRQGELLPAVHNVIAEQMGYRTSNVRLANLV